MVSVADERIMVQCILKAWPGADEAAVKVGGIVRAERKEYLPEGATVPRVSYMVVSPRAAKAAEKAERQEERMAALEARVEKLERLLAMKVDEAIRSLLRERTEAAERRAGGNPDARHAGTGDGPTEEYLRTMADPERKVPLVPFGRLA